MREEGQLRVARREDGTTGGGNSRVEDLLLVLGLLLEDLGDLLAILVCSAENKRMQVSLWYLARV